MRYFVFVYFLLFVFSRFSCLLISFSDFNFTHVFQIFMLLLRKFLRFLSPFSLFILSFSSHFPLPLALTFTSLTYALFSLPLLLPPSTPFLYLTFPFSLPSPCLRPPLSLSSLSGYLKWNAMVPGLSRRVLAMQKAG
jgi:hypothetical protein